MWQCGRQWLKHVWVDYATIHYMRLAHQAPDYASWLKSHTTCFAWARTISTNIVFKFYGESWKSMKITILINIHRAHPEGFWPNGLSANGNHPAELWGTPPYATRENGRHLSHFFPVSKADLFSASLEHSTSLFPVWIFGQLIKMRIFLSVPDWKLWAWLQPIA